MADEGTVVPAADDSGAGTLTTSGSAAVVTSACDGATSDPVVVGDGRSTDDLVDGRPQDGAVVLMARSLDGGSVLRVARPDVAPRVADTGEVVTLTGTACVAVDVGEVDVLVLGSSQDWYDAPVTYLDDTVTPLADGSWRASFAMPSEPVAVHAACLVDGEDFWAGLPTVVGVGDVAVRPTAGVRQGADVLVGVGELRRERRPEGPVLRLAVPVDDGPAAAVHDAASAVGHRPAGCLTWSARGASARCGRPATA